MPSAVKEFAGSLQRRITIEQSSEAADGSGNQIVTWTTVATVWAAMRALGGSQASGLTAEVVYEFRTRWRNDITVGPRKMRVGISGSVRKFDLTAAFDPTDDKKELVMHATELVG